MVINSCNNELLKATITCKEEQCWYFCEIVVQDSVCQYDDLKCNVILITAMCFTLHGTKVSHCVHVCCRPSSFYSQMIYCEPHADLGCTCAWWSKPRNDIDPFINWHLILLMKANPLPLWHGLLPFSSSDIYWEWNALFLRSVWEWRSLSRSSSLLGSDFENTFKKWHDCIYVHYTCMFWKC